MEKYFLAIDIGASGGRHILGCLKDGKIELEEVYRFENGMDKTEETGEDGRKKTVLVWNLDRLFSEIITGMKKCKELGRIPESVGIDTWGVDYVLLDENDKDTTYRFDAKVDNLMLEVDFNIKSGRSDLSAFNAKYYSQFINGVEYDSFLFSNYEPYTNNMNREELKGYNKQSLDYIFAKWLVLQDNSGTTPFSEDDLVLKDGKIIVDKVITNLDLGTNTQVLVTVIPQLRF